MCPTVPGLSGAKPPRMPFSVAGVNWKGIKLELVSESISEPVFDSGSLSALVVLMTLGNAAQVDPAEERGAPSGAWMYQSALAVALL